MTVQEENSCILNIRHGSPLMQNLVSNCRCSDVCGTGEILYVPPSPAVCSEVRVAESLRHSQQSTSPFLHCIKPFEQWTLDSLSKCFGNWDVSDNAQIYHNFNSSNLTSVSGHTNGAKKGLVQGIMCKILNAKNKHKILMSSEISALFKK